MKRHLAGSQFQSDDDFMAEVNDFLNAQDFVYYKNWHNVLATSMEEVYRSQIFFFIFFALHSSFTDRPIPKKATTPLRNDIRCTQTSIEVFIPVEYAKTEFYVLRDPSCGTTNNGTHLLIKFNLGECGTQLEFKEDSLVFSNQLEEGSDSNEVISIQCEYPRHQNVSLYNISVTSASKIFIYEKGRGVGFMTIRQFTSGDFAEPFAPSMEQTTFKPGDLVYIEMDVEGAFSDAADVGLIADSCTVDPMSRGGGKGILLVENNCPKAAGVKIYETEKQFFHFHFPAPDFNITGRVQVNCRVSACNKMLDCSTNCNRKRRSIRSSSDSLLLTSEPIFVKTTSGKYVSKEAIATSCLSVLSLVLIIAVVILVKDRRKFNNRALVLANEIQQ